MIPETIVQMQAICGKCESEFELVSIDALVEVKCKCKSKIFRVSEYEYACNLTDARMRSAMLGGFVMMEHGRENTARFVEDCPKDKDGMLAWFKEQERRRML